MLILGGTLLCMCHHNMLDITCMMSAVPWMTLFVALMLQTRYMLGDAGRSFVVGYGINPPTHVHHRGASCPRYPQPCGKQYFNSGDPNQFVLYGALVGGPDAADVYNDIRADYTANEVAVDYNAAFTGLMAAMMQAGISYAECPGAKPTPAKT